VCIKRGEWSIMVPLRWIRKTAVIALAMGGALAFPMGDCIADSIRVDGETLDDVYINEGAAMYYVLIPDTGTIRNVGKSEIDATDVVISSDRAHRKALLTEWKAAKAARQGQTPGPSAAAERTSEQSVQPDAAVASASAPHDDKPKVLRLRGSARNGAPSPGQPEAAYATVGPVTDGYIARVDLKDVPLKQALKATLRSKNLDYAVEGSHLWVSTPQRLRHESFQRRRTRTYRPRTTSADTLPKIVVRNPGGRSGPTKQISGSGYGYGTGGYGVGAGGYGGGRAARYGGGYASGGYGLGGGGFGGYGGYGGGYGGVRQFSNISELFSTIDDRLVGETPAVIGTAGLSGIGP